MPVSRPADPEWNRRYQAVLASAAWKKRRRALIMAARFRCAICQVQTLDFKEFEIHHKTYERLGRERDADLEVVHVSCHPRADVIRARERAAYAANCLYAARVDGLREAVGHDLSWEEAEALWNRRYGRDAD